VINKDNVLATLRAHEAELKRAGIMRLSLFGSVARGETGHDIDLLAAFDDAQRLSLVDVVGLEHWLEDLLGADVDLVQDGTLKDGIRQRVEREAVRAF
jgi:predicted nucleotidyltransferase